MTENWNVRHYGDTRWNRLGDRLEWIMDVIVMPVFFILMFGGFSIGIIILLVAGLVALLT